MAQTNLLQWSNSIRLNMANDSGREYFQQQVQTQGFLFLDDYLDNILSGTKQDPLIDLVKTPGRRKIVGKKPKLASKLGNPIVFSLGPSIDENAPFQEITTTKPSPVPESHSKKPEPSPPSDLKPKESRPILSDIQTPLNSLAEAPSSLATPHIETPVFQNDQLSPAPLEQANLSVIAEDEEPAERSRTSIRPTILSPEPPLPKAPSPRPTPEPSLPTAVPVAITQEAKADASDEEDNDDEDGTPERDASFHSVPINSPSDYHSAQATPMSPTFPVNATGMPENNAPQASPELDEDMIIESSPPPESGPTDTGHTMAPFDFTEVLDMQVPLRDADSSNKTVSMAIPSLPEPMPLRKSIRAARDPSVGATLMGGATPGNPAGKRTSWLMKAREVKALDMTTKKAPSNVFAALPEPGRSSASGSKRKSGDVDALGAHLNDHERKSKVAKHIDGDSPSSKASDSETKPLPSVSSPAKSTPEPQTSPGVLDRLKKTVEGLVGKTTTKSNSGVSVVNAIAEAKAAAEARIAERNHHEGSVSPPKASPQHAQPEKMEVEPNTSRPPPMSLTDLFPSEGRIKEKHKAPERPFQFSPPRQKQGDRSKRESTSTTPPHSPPAPAPSSSFSIPTGPVFNKPAPVFVPPAPLPGTRPLPSPPAFKEYTFQAPPQSVYSATLGLSSSRAFTAPSAKPLTAQSTMESIQSQSQRLFDDDDDVPAWMPTTQDTEYTETTGFETQHDQQMVCDEDDSWPMDEKLSAGVQWTFNGKEDSMTWSTLPSQSQRGGDTGYFGSEKTTSSLRNVVPPEEPREPKEDETSSIPGAFDFNMEQGKQEADLDEIVSQDKELAEAVLGNTKASAPAETKSFRPQSQLSMASSSSSQSQPQQGGFLNQASKLFSNAWGNGKKKQPEVKKVLGMAAAAAKKQQEEADKKAARLKEMEIRRQQAIQRKAEEEKARQMEEEQKMKEEMERRKREREEQTDKRPIIKPTPAKKEEDVQAKKKPQIEKKPELKKTTSVSSLNKSHLKPILKPSGSKPMQGGSSQQPTAGPSSKPVESSKLPKFAPSSSSKAKAKVPAMTEDELGQPAHFLQEQMAARAKAQIQAAKQAEQLVPSESIELPDINSEYSDSEDEDRPRTYDPPNWAQSPELKEALKQQSTINPDDIFGAVRPLRMEEIFKTRTSRFRARTSSANWTGSDRLTVQEEKEYAARMGFK